MRSKLERRVLDGTVSVAHFAAQTLPGKTGRGVDDGDAHAGLLDVIEITLQGTAWADLHAGNVLTHVAGNVPRLEERGPEGRAVSELCELQCTVRAGFHAQTALHAQIGEVLGSSGGTGRPALTAGALGKPEQPESGAGCEPGPLDGDLQKFTAIGFHHLVSSLAVPRSSSRRLRSSYSRALRRSDRWRPRRAC
jgi:hypothetical protein